VKKQKEMTTGAKSDLPPIVFIHGWKASVLVSKKTGAVAFDFTLDRFLGLTPGNVLDLPMQWDPATDQQLHDDLEASHPMTYVKCLCGTVKLLPVYGPLLEHLRASGRDVREFAYDWRRDLAETSAAAEAFLRAVADETRRPPQVIAHSMGCLVTLHVLNRAPTLFHSVLFGAGAMSPAYAPLEDFSVAGNANNKILRNDTMFTPAQHLTNTGAVHMLAALPNERARCGKEHTVLLEDAAGKPVDLDLTALDTWKKHGLGMYHPASGVTVTPDKETWLTSVLERCHAYRTALLPQHSPDTYPPLAVLNSDGVPTSFKFHLDADGQIDFEHISTLPGDGRIVCEDACPPEGYPLVMKLTNQRAHLDVLNDVESVDKLLACLLSSKTST